MDVVLGAAVTGPVARLALVDGSTGDRSEVVDQSAVDLGPDPARDLAEAIIGTQRLLTDDGHRLVGTRVCWPDERGMHQLRQALAGAGISDVVSVPASNAALAKVRDVSRTPGVSTGTAALLFCDADTATLSIVDATTAATTVYASESLTGSDTVTACTSLLARLNRECGAAGSLFLMGAGHNLGDVAQHLRAAAPVPLMIPDDTDLAFAHGATMADIGAPQHLSTAPFGGFGAESAPDSLNMGPTSPSPQIGPQLAYSQVPDSASLPLLGSSGNNDPGQIPSQSKMSPLSWADDDDEDDDTVAAGAVAARPRFLLLGSGIAAAIVVAFSALAITVAIGIHPDAQQVAIAPPKSHAMPQFHPLPTNPAAPLPLDPGSAPPVQAKVPVVAGGGTATPAELASAIGYPAAIPPGAPAPVGLPDIPQAPAGPQLPGWGMPGFTMPPIYFNIANPSGVADTGWHWITDGHGNRWWVPNNVWGAATVMLVDGLMESHTPNTSVNAIPGDNSHPVIVDHVGGQTLLAHGSDGKPILTLDQPKDGLPTPATDQKKDAPPILATDKKEGTVLAGGGGGGVKDATLPGAGGPKDATLPGAGGPKDATLPGAGGPKDATLPGPKDAGLLPGADPSKGNPVLAGTGGPDKSLLPNAGDKALIPPPDAAHSGSVPEPGIVKNSPVLPHVDPPSGVPLPPATPPKEDKQIPNGIPVVPAPAVKPAPVPVAPAPVPVAPAPVPEAPAPVWHPATPPVVQAPAPVAPAPAPMPEAPAPVWQPPKWTPPVVQAPPPMFQAPSPPVFQAPSPPVFQAPQMPALPPIFGGGGGGGGGGLFGGGGGGLFGGGGGRHH